MSEKELSARPNLEQYKKQAKDLARDCSLRLLEAQIRVYHHHPQFHRLTEAEMHIASVSLTDAQLVLAREHGFESWPKFAKHIETLRLIREVEEITDPIAAFIEVACAPRHAGHASGSLEHAEMILAKYPHVATANVHTAAILADAETVARLLAADVANATEKGGPHGWDALTHLCFSRYLRIDRERSDAFVHTAKLLLDAGASAKTGWYEMIDHPKPRPVLESVLYGAAGVARHVELTRLLLEYGADPNDEETPYHVPEGYDNEIMRVVLQSGRLEPMGLATMLVRKADWHDLDGLRLLLGHGASPNLSPKFGCTALAHAVHRDNRLAAIEALLDHGGDPSLVNTRDGMSATMQAARRGRGDVLELLESRGFTLDLRGVDVLIAACAKADHAAIEQIQQSQPGLVAELLRYGGALLAQFAGTANVEGMRCLLELGVPVNALYGGDGYFEIAWSSTALHVAAWRAWPAVVQELIAQGAAVNALDGRGRSALALAVKACVDSYWANRRSPDSVRMLLAAGAKTDGIDLPTGYDEIDLLLRQHPG